MNVLFVITIFITLSFGTAEQPVKIKTTILYESLCPDCQTFIISQLGPNFEPFENYLELELVPFGNAKSINDTHFSCQHGPNECVNNMVQSCAFKNLEGHEITQAEFAQCQMHNPDNTGKKCADIVDADYNAIRKCVSLGEGIKLQLDAEKRTQQFNPEWVPSIIFNEKLNKKLSEEAASNFKAVICRLTYNQPSVCKKLILLE